MYLCPRFERSMGNPSGTLECLLFLSDGRLLVWKRYYIEGVDTDVGRSRRMR